MPAGSPIDNSPNIDAHNIDIISQVKGYTLRVDNRQFVLWEYCYLWLTRHISNMVDLRDT